MKLRVCVVGKPKLLYAREGVEDYAERILRYTKFDLVPVREGRKEKEGERLLEASNGYLRVVLDERGQQVDTVVLKNKLELWEHNGEKGIAFLIGGADGHSEAVKEAAVWTFALSKLTLQHELALVVLLEQLYRVETIKRREPYHR